MLETFWVMDTDLCDECGELLEDWCICPACGYDGIDWEDDDEDDEDEWTIYREMKHNPSLRSASGATITW